MKKDIIDELIESITISGMTQLMAIQKSEIKKSVKISLEQSIFDSMLEQYNSWLNSVELTEEQINRIQAEIRKVISLKNARIEHYSEDSKEENPNQKGE